MLLMYGVMWCSVVWWRGVVRKEGWIGFEILAILLLSTEAVQCGSQSKSPLYTASPQKLYSVALRV